jgi:hypothetical protein
MAAREAKPKTQNRGFLPCENDGVGNGNTQTAQVGQLDGARLATPRDMKIAQFVVGGPT